jgi:hypothetical protein
VPAPVSVDKVGVNLDRDSEIGGRQSFGDRTCKLVQSTPKSCIDFRD